MKLIWVDESFYVGFMGIYEVQSQIIQLMIGCTAPWGFLVVVDNLGRLVKSCGANWKMGVKDGSTTFLIGT